MNQIKTIDIESEIIKSDNILPMNSIKTMEDYSKPFSVFKEIQDHNEKMLKELPMLKETTLLIVGNQYFRPQQYDIEEARIESLKKDFNLNADEQNMIQTSITVDDQPITLHQHISALTQVDKSYTPQNVLNFNYNSIKNIFQNKIPLCFKQCIVLLAYSRQEPEILSLGFENSEFEEVKKLLITELDNKKLNHA